ncbi:hypothetical protein EMCRGX_G020447 [Ephydatia muelleri]
MFYLVLKEIKCHMEIGDAVTSGKKLDTQISLAGINPLCQSCTTLSTRCGMNTKGVPFISSPPDEIVKENTAISPLSQIDAWRFEPPETPGSYVVTYRLRSLSLFQG